MQILSNIFHRIRTNNSMIFIEPQKTLNTLRNIEKKEWSWKNQPSCLQTILQSYSHRESKVLEQRQKYRSLEQNRKPRDKSMYQWTPYL